MLVVWRTTDAAPLAADLGFGAHLPEWLAPRDVRDLVRDGRERSRLSRGAIHGALWIEGASQCTMVEAPYISNVRWMPDRSSNT